MLRRALLLVLAALALVVAATRCGDGGSLERAAARVADQDNPAALNVLAKGDTTEQSIVLLYDAEVGDTWEGTMRHDLTIEGETFGQSLDMRVETTDVADDGDVTNTITFTGVEITEAPPGSDPADIEARMDGLVGTTMVVVTDAFGYPVSTDTEFAAGIDPTLRQTMTEMEDALVGASHPVPKDELGIGAMWTSTGEIDLNGVNTLTTATYELVAIDGDTYTLDVAIEQTQTGEGTEQGTAFAVTGHGSGRGTVEGTRQAPMPLRAETSVEAEARFDVPDSSESMATVAWTLVEGEIVD